MSQRRIAIFVLGPSALPLAQSLKAALGGQIHGPEGLAGCDYRFAQATQAMERVFREGQAVVGLCAAGILIRAIAPHLKDKSCEAPVVAVAEDGSSSVPLLGGHSGANELARQLESGQVLLLENLRFHAEEEANDPGFSKALASLAEVYVNDAFGSAHRAHASTEGITHFLKPAVAGLLMEKEITYLGKALESPEKPFVAIIGGSKISGKIDVIENLLDKVDTLVIVGGMAYTFQRALGVTTGKSLVEEDKIDMAKDALAKAKAKGVTLLLPVDNVLADSFSNDAKTQPWDTSKNFPADWQGLDIGPKSIAAIEKVVSTARTIVWNGPAGVFEFPKFAVGTNAIAKAVAANKAATSIIGGGDSVSAINQAGVADKITHISTGGGASLEFLEGKKLLGVEALADK